MVIKEINTPESELVAALHVNGQRKMRANSLRRKIEYEARKIRGKIPYVTFALDVLEERLYYELDLRGRSRVRADEILQEVIGGELDLRHASTTEGILKVKGSSPKDNFEMVIFQSRDFQVEDKQMQQEFFTDDRRCIRIRIVDNRVTIERRLKEVLGDDLVSKVEQSRGYTELAPLETAELEPDQSSVDEISQPMGNGIIPIPVAEESEPEEIIMGYVLDGSSTTKFRLQLSEDQIGRPIKGRWGWLTVGDQRCLFFVEESYLNGERIVMEDLPADIQNFRDQFALDCVVFTATPGDSLLATPQSATKAYFLDRTRLIEFYDRSDPDTPITFLKSVEYGFPLPLDLMKLKQHGMIIAMTGAGKGYFANAMLCASTGAMFRADDGLRYPTGVLYIDTNGQWNQPGGKYGFFEPTGSFPAPVIYNLQDVNPPLFSDYVWNTLYMDELPYNTTKKTFLRRRLSEVLDPGMKQNQFFQTLEDQIPLIYSTRVEDRLLQLDMFLTSDNMPQWDEICENYLELITDSIPNQTVFDQLIQGNMIVIDASQLDNNQILFESLSGFLEAITDMAINLWRARGMADNCVPIITAIDEIHKFCPSPGSATLTDELRSIKEFILTWSKEYRKYGTMLLGITQNPGQVEKNLLRNISMKIAGRLDEDSDRKKIEDNWHVELPLLPDYQFVVWKGGIAKFGNQLLKVKAMKPEEMEERSNGN